MPSTIFIVARVFLFACVAGGVMWWFHLKDTHAFQKKQRLAAKPCPTAESVVARSEPERTPELLDVPPNQEKHANAFKKHAERFDDAYARIQRGGSSLAQRRRLYSVMLDAAARCMRCLYLIRMWMHNDLMMEERMRTFELICDDYFARCIRCGYKSSYTPADETLIARKWNRRWSDPLPVYKGV